MKKIKDLKKGSYFTLNKIEATSNDIYVRGEYIREAKKYSCYKYNDVNKERLLSGNKQVVNDFYTIENNFDVPY